MFDAFKDGWKVATNEHPVADFLPVRVELTEGSMHAKSSSLTNKQQRFCLQASCVVRLKEFCALVRPELLNPSSWAIKAVASGGFPPPQGTFKLNFDRVGCSTKLGNGS
eukprot:scaffold68631_cov36-Phaeocystis_antarctica.AAC.1